MDKPGLIGSVLFHALFYSFGDLESNVLNYLSVPLREFIASSLERRYAIPPDSEQFELAYSAIASAFFVGAIIASLMMARCMDRYGRKGTAVYLRSSLGIIAALAMLMAKWSGMVELFVIGHMLAGAISALKTVMFIYVAECAPDRARGWSSTAIGSGSNLMLLIASPLCLPALFGNSWSWWLLPAGCLMLAMCHLFGAAHFPESPKQLYIGNGAKEEAKQSAMFYHGSNANLAELFDEFEHERHVMHNETVGWTEFWTSHRLRCSIAITLMASSVPALSLINLKSQYLEPMLMRYGLDQSEALVFTMAMTALTAPLCLVAPCLIESWGRRPLFLLITSLSTLELTLMTGAQCLYDILGGGGLIVSMLALIGCTMGQASVNLGIFNMTPILVGELFPHPARARATQIALLIPNLIVVGIVLAYPSLIVSVGALFFLPLAAFSTLILLLMIKFLPETKGRPVDDIFRRLADSRTNSVTDYGAIGGGAQKWGDQIAITEILFTRQNLQRLFYFSFPLSTIHTNQPEPQANNLIESQPKIKVESNEAAI
uniref:Major facilitator superfamily (MFS) profile domain-containing protein n=1 Tax=Globodera rostochiensis TaxID=31243 RepID=A0A914GRY3_GLORO